MPEPTPDHELADRFARAATDAVADVRADAGLDTAVDRHRAAQRRRAVRGWAVGAAAALALVAGTAVVVTRGGDDRPDRVDPVHVGSTTTSTAPSATTEPGADDPNAVPGSWEPVADVPFTPVSGSNAITAWTGTELLVWQWPNSTAGPESRFVAYDPAADAWRDLAPPPVKLVSGGVWTGAELVVGPGVALDTSEDDVAADAYLAAYDPVADTWRVVGDGPIDRNLGSPVAWTGTDLIFSGSSYSRTAPWAYDPATGTGRELPPVPVTGQTGDRPYGGTWYVAAGDGRLAAVSDANSPVITVSVAGPALDSWEAAPASPVGPGGEGIDAVWSDTELIVVGDGAAAYDPATRTWRALPDPPGPAAGDDPAPAVLGGFGGVWNGDRFLSAVGVLDPEAGTWQAWPSLPEERLDPIVAWLADRLVVVGGNRPCEVPEDPADYSCPDTPERYPSTGWVLALDG